MTNQVLEKDIDPSPLVAALIEKSKAGRLKWEPTADSNTFIASVGGGTTIRIELSSEEGYDEYGQPAPVAVPELRLLNEKGKLLWEVHSGEVKSGLWPLFKIAQRIANKLDERVALLLESLQRL